MLAANNVMLYSKLNDEKSSIAERWNRTMKNIMWKYFTANNTQKYGESLNEAGNWDELQTLFHPIVNATKQAADETRKELAPMKK